MGRYQQAYDAYRGDLSSALLFNLEAYPEALSLLRPFFPQGWATLPKDVAEDGGSYLATCAAGALQKIGAPTESLAALGAALVSNLGREYWPAASTQLRNLSVTLRAQNRLAGEERGLLSVMSLAELTGDGEEIFMARLFRFDQLATIGKWDDARAAWDLLDPMGRNWSRAVYRPGTAEYWYAIFRFWQGDLTEAHLDHTPKS